MNIPRSGSEYAYIVMHLKAGFTKFDPQNTEFSGIFTANIELIFYIYELPWWHGRNEKKKKKQLSLEWQRDTGRHVEFNFFYRLSLDFERII